jgi:predicted Zn-dependent protease
MGNEAIGKMRLLTIPLLLLLLSGCVTNPVTGKTELGLVSESQEIAIGRQQYLPSRQMQGGDYLVDQALSAYVSEVGQNLAAVSDRALEYEFTIINSSVPNAWALPGGKIALNRGLLTELASEAELAAVLGHEVVHAAARHGARGVERGLLLQGAVLATAIAARDHDYGQYAVGAATLGAQLINQGYSRGQELEADYYGMLYMSRAGYDPSGAVDLQKTFVRLSENRQQDWLSGLFASHPPSDKRVQANQKTATELAVGGRIAKGRYQKSIAHLVASKPAYDAYTQGRKALKDGVVKTALKEADRAIKIEPEEALFYGLKGDANYARKRYQQAIKFYSEALRRDDAYFKYYLGRGESYRELGQTGKARQDLEKSNSLLPTANANNSLGLLAEKNQQPDQAIEYYRIAFNSGTPAGLSAGKRLIELDLPRNPGRYLPGQLHVDQSGRVYIELSNRTQMALGQIRIELAWRDDNGKIRRQYSQQQPLIRPGANAIVMLGSDPFASVYDSLEFAVRSAKVLD